MRILSNEEVIYWTNKFDNGRSLEKNSIIHDPKKTFAFAFNFKFSINERSVSNWTLSPVFPTSFSTLSTSPSFTRYCFPPVLITANIELNGKIVPEHPYTVNGIRERSFRGLKSTFLAK